MLQVRLQPNIYKGRLKTSINTEISRNHEHHLKRRTRRTSRHKRCRPHRPNRAATAFCRGGEHRFRPQRRVCGNGFERKRQNRYRAAGGRRLGGFAFSDDPCPQNNVIVN